MLTFYTRKPDERYPETVFKCPYCEHTLTFYSLSPETCSMCYQPVPFNANKLLRNQGTARKDYHVNDN